MSECPPCKIIINGGFIAPLAAALARKTRDNEIQSAARDLADAAELQVRIVDSARSFGLLKFEPDFSGCGQAKALLSWVRRAKTTTAHSEEDIAKMRDWTAMLYENIQQIVEGSIDLSGAE
jgi:hypothetical protein